MPACGVAAKPNTISGSMRGSARPFRENSLAWGPAAAQDLIDTVFRHLDPAMRELGVGDMAVPKRMKKLAEAFLGRSVAYDSALQQSGDRQLAEALSRNVYAGARPADDLARYVRAAALGLDALQLDDVLQQAIRFPDPTGFLIVSAAS
jgi:cytochrome b pre-mRNA-processing protein 3